MNEVKLHVAGIDGFFSDARQAAGRVESGDLAAQGAVIAFESMDVLLKALTAGRWRLLRRLRADGPTSIRRLARLLERDYRGVHADVAALVDVGLIARTKDGRITVPWDRISAEMDIGLTA